MDFAHANPEKTKQILRKRFPNIAQDTFEASFRSSLVATPKTPVINAAMAQRAIDFTNAVARTPLKVTAQQLVNEEIFRMAEKARK